MSLLLHFYTEELKGKTIIMKMKDEKQEIFKARRKVQDGSTLSFELSQKNQTQMIYTFYEDDSFFGEFELLNSKSSCLFYFPDSLGNFTLHRLLNSFKHYFLLAAGEATLNQKTSVIDSLIDETESFFKRMHYDIPCEKQNWAGEDDNDLFPKLFGFFLMTCNKKSLFRILKADAATMARIAMTLKDQGNAFSDKYYEKREMLKDQIKCLDFLSGSGIGDPKSGQMIWEMLQKEIDADFRMESASTLTLIEEEFVHREKDGCLKLIQLSTDLSFTLRTVSKYKPALEGFQGVLERQSYGQIKAEEKEIQNLGALISEINKYYGEAKLAALIVQKLRLSVQDNAVFLGFCQTVFTEPGTRVHPELLVEEFLRTFIKKGLKSVRYHLNQAFLESRKIEPTLKARIVDHLACFFCSRIRFYEFIDLILLCKISKDLTAPCEELKACLNNLIEKGEFTALFVMIEETTAKLEDQNIKDVFWINLRSLESCGEKAARETLERLCFMLNWEDFKGKKGLDKCIGFFRSLHPDRPVDERMSILEIVESGFYLYELTNKHIPPEEANDLYRNKIKHLNELEQEKEKFLEILRCPNKRNTLISLITKSPNVSRRNILHYVNDFLERAKNSQKDPKENFVFIMFLGAGLNKLMACESSSGKIELTSDLIIDGSVEASVGTFKITSPCENKKVELIFDESLKVQVELDKKYKFLVVRNNSSREESSPLASDIFKKIPLLVEAALRGTFFFSAA